MLSVLHDIITAIAEIH